MPLVSGKRNRIKVEKYQIEIEKYLDISPAIIEFALLVL